MIKESEPKFIHTPEQTQLRREVSRYLGAYLATKSMDRSLHVKLGDHVIPFNEVCNSLLNSFENGRVFLYISPERDNQLSEAKLRKQVVSKYISDKLLNDGVPQDYIDGFSSLVLQADMVCLCVGTNPNFDLEDKLLQKTLVQLYLLDASLPLGMYPPDFDIQMRNSEAAMDNSFRVYRLSSFDPITYTNPNVGFYITE